jgi:hypothetical protein
MEAVPGAIRKPAGWNVRASARPGDPGRLERARFGAAP